MNDTLIQAWKILSDHYEETYGDDLTTAYVVEVDEETKELSIESFIFSSEPKQSTSELNELKNSPLYKAEMLRNFLGGTI